MLRGRAGRGRLVGDVTPARDCRTDRCHLIWLAHGVGAAEVRGCLCAVSGRSWILGVGAGCPDFT